MHIRELIGRIEETADPSRAATWDHSGVQVAGTLTTCDKLAVALDPLPETVEAALAWGAQCILTHHPVTLSPCLPDRLDDFHRLLRGLLGAGAWLYAAHTSLDVVTDGPAGWLADALALQDRRILEPAGAIPSRQACWKTATPQAAVAALAEVTGVTSVCLGTTTLDVVFPPRLRGLVEKRLSAACPDATLVSLIDVVEPAAVYGYGLVGMFPTPLSFSELEKKLAGWLPRKFFIVAGTPPVSVSCLAYCPGSGADMAPRAFAAGATVYVTGDLKYHQAQAIPPGACILDVGHFALEEIMMRTFATSLAQRLDSTGLTVRFFPGKDPFAAYFPEGPTPPRTEE